MHGIFEGSLVGIGQAEVYRLALVIERTVGPTRPFYPHIGIHFRGPTESGFTQTVHSLIYHRVAPAVEDDSGRLEKFEFLLDFLLPGRKAFLMGGTDVGQQANSTLQGTRQVFHLPRLGYTSFEQA